MNNRMVRITRGACFSKALLLLCFGYLVIARSMIAQSAKIPSPAGQQTTELQRAISRVRSGTFESRDIATIVRAHETQAVPALESQFPRITNPYLMGRTADALICLGASPQVYWPVMLDNAREILRDVPPTAFEYDASGAVVPGRTSKRLSDWTAKHNIVAGCVFCFHN
jgi:hypothetical protein